MVGLICLWNSYRIGCGTVIMSVLEVVVCWNFDALVWSCLLCVLLVACCVQCVVLAYVVLVLRYLLFAWPVHLGLYCWCREKN